MGIGISGFSSLVLGVSPGIDGISNPESGFLVYSVGHGASH